MNLESYCKVPKDFLMASGFISKTEPQLVVELTPAAKLIYVYMLDKNKFFLNNLKSEHYETQATIARFCSLEVKTATRLLGLFVHHGALRAELLRKKNVSPHLQWYYREVVTDIELTNKVGGKHVSVESGVIYDKIAPKTLPKRKGVAKIVNEGIPEYTEEDLIGVVFTEDYYHV